MDPWLAANPQITSLRVAACDLNGQARGKRTSADAAEKLLSQGIRMPVSALCLDIRGDDIEGSALVFETGDQDGIMRPTERGCVPMPWLETPTALLPVWGFTEAGAPFDADPRQALASVLDRYAAHGWTPVCATELEFFLVAADGVPLQPPVSPLSGLREHGGEILSVRALDAFEGFFSALFEAAGKMGIKVEAAISESGLGQFEVNLTHGPAMRIADDTYLFKMLTKGLALAHGFRATFMAKPYGTDAGSGLHVHASVEDEAGRNVFDDGSETGTPTLGHAVAGCLEAMADSTLIFGPHGNSYARFVPGAHAPTGIGWAYENRTAAVRIPGGPPRARRFEHRVAGGDTNPYLMLAAILGAAIDGIEREAKPPAPITGNAYSLDLPRIHASWTEAIEAFEASEILPRFLPEDLLRALAATKRQELGIYAELPPAERVSLYLDSV